MGLKLRIKVQALARALFRVQGVVDKRSTNPALAHVLLTASEGELLAAATDADLSISGSYPAEVAAPGSLAVPARPLFEVVRALTADEVELEEGKHKRMSLRAGPSRFQLVGMAAEDFPELGHLDQIDAFPLGAAKLMAMVERTLFSVSQDENRHHLGGIFCQTPRPSTLRMVSTDGHRLALADGQFDTTLRLEGGVIVPRKAWVELRRVVGDARQAELPIAVGFRANTAVFRHGGVSLSTRLIEGQFPNYQQVIPEGADKRAILPRRGFAEALRRVSLLSDGTSYGVRCRFAGGQLTLRAENPEQGEAEESISIAYDGPELTVGFNARYILDVLQWAHAEEVVFELADNLSPAILRPKDEPGFTAIVMPMRF